MARNHRTTAAVALTAATLGATLLLTAPAHAGVIIPQVRVQQAGIIVPQVKVQQAGIIMDDATGFPPGPTVTVSV